VKPPCSHTNLESLVHAIPCVIYRVDLTTHPEGQLVFLNSKMKELCGYSSDEFLQGQMKWFDLVLEEDLPIVQKAVTASAPEKAYRLEYRIRHKHGNILWVLNLGNITASNETAVWSDGIIIDITASKLQEAELTLRQKELNTLIISLDDIVLLIDSDGCIKNYFAKDRRSLILPPSTFLGKTIVEAFSDMPAYATLFDEAYRKTIATKQNLEIEYSVQNDEKVLWYRARYLNLEEAGTVSVLVTDITKEKEARLALKKNEQLLRWASETAKIGGWELDINTMTLVWDDEIHRIREVEKANSHTLQEAFKYYEEEGKSTVANAIQDAIQHGTSWDLELPIITYKGNKKWIRLIGIPEMKDGKCIILRGVLNDITEKKNTELELLKREQELELAIKGADLGTWDWDVATGSVKVNPRFTEMLGYNHEETNLHISIADQLIHPDDKDRVIEALIAHLKNKNDYYQVEYRLKHKLGHWVWVLDKGRVVQRNAKNRPLRVSGTRLDITDRKLSEINLREVNIELEQFKLAINTASIVTMTDIHGRIEFVNQKFLDITKYSRQELIGQKHTIVNSRYHSKQFWKEMWRTIGNGEIWRAEVCNRAKTGELYWVDTFIIPIKTKSGKITKYLSIRNEITQRKKDQEKLQLLSMVASQTSNYVIITDRQGHIEWVNESFERATGYTQEEIKGRKPESFLQGEETNLEVLKHISEMIGKGKSFSCELINYTKTKEKYWVQVTTQPLRDADGKIIRYFSIMRNVTGHKKLLNELELAKEKAVESDRLKSAFLANISHEIRTPMNAIMGFAELLEKPTLPEQKRETFSKLIHSRSKDLLSIVNDILDISKIEAGQITPVPVAGNLAELFDRLLMNFNEETIHLRNKQITLRISNTLPAHQNIILADFNKLNQVLTNLLTNAAKFTQEGIIGLTCLLISSPELLFVVSDTGIGIPNDQHEVIFKPFRQATESTHQQYGGSGLGLAICKGLVELWGGRIWVRSELGKGSTFYFTMPYVPAASADNLITERLKQ